jgi:3-dehydroquinate dehydratase-1
MIKIGKITLGTTPQIALAVGEYTDDLHESFNNGTSILEIRIDLFSNFDSDFVMSQLEKFKRLDMPLIATIRTTSEKGKWNRSESEREKLFYTIIDLVDAIDIELSSDQINRNVSSYCNKKGKTLIVSNHDFNGTPDNAILQKQFDDAKGLGADIVKLACLSKKQEEVTQMLEFVNKNKEQGIIGISMGSVGAISRVVAPIFGSLITYTSTELNYGQLSLRDLLDMSRLLYPSFNQEFIITRKSLEFV